MAEIKFVIGDPKEKKSYQKVSENTLIGRKLGEKISGDLIGIPGYEFEIRGGSDRAGFPMRSDIQGTQLKKALLTKSVGYQKGNGEIKKRKTVRGNTVSEDTSQVNVKIIKYGSKNLVDILGLSAKAETKSEEKAEK